MKAGDHGYTMLMELEGGKREMLESAVTNKKGDYERYGESRIHDRSGEMERVATVIQGRKFGLGRFQLKAITYHLAPT